MIEAWRRAAEPDAADSMVVAETSVTPEGGLPGAQPELVPAARTPAMAVRPDPSYRSSSRIARVGRAHVHTAIRMATRSEKADRRL
jgi:hypothetical protein